MQLFWKCSTTSGLFLSHESISQEQVCLARWLRTKSQSPWQISKMCGHSCPTFSGSSVLVSSMNNKISWFLLCSLFPILVSYHYFYLFIRRSLSLELVPLGDSLFSDIAYEVLMDVSRVRARPRFVSPSLPPSDNLVRGLHDMDSLLLLEWLYTKRKVSP